MNKYLRDNYIKKDNHSLSGKSGFAVIWLLRTWFVSFLLINISVVSIMGQTVTDKSADPNSFSNSHQTGIRLGGWINYGDLPVDSIPDGGLIAVSDLSNGSFFLEGYIGFRLSSSFIAEASLGIASRGDLTVKDTLLGNSFIGTLVVYPIMAKLKFYPLRNNATVQPYLLAGGGIYYGKHDIQFSSSFFAPVGFQSASETTINYVVGGGVDYPLASVIGLDFNVQYMPIKFSKELIGSRDYSALTISVGVKYLYSSTKKR